MLQSRVAGAAGEGKFADAHGVRHVRDRRHGDASVLQHKSVLHPGLEIPAIVKIEVIRSVEVRSQDRTLRPEEKRVIDGDPPVNLRGVQRLALREDIGLIAAFEDEWANGPFRAEERADFLKARDWVGIKDVDERPELRMRELAQIE